VGSPCAELIVNVGNRRTKVNLISGSSSQTTSNQPTRRPQKRPEDGWQMESTFKLLAKRVESRGRP
jgi:hypothetical protein